MTTIWQDRELEAELVGKENCHFSDACNELDIFMCQVVGGVIRHEYDWEAIRDVCRASYLLL